MNLDSDIDSDENELDPDLDQTSQDNDDSDVDSDEVQSSQGDDIKDHQDSGSDDDNISDNGDKTENDNGHFNKQSSANDIDNDESDDEDDDFDEDDSDDSTSIRKSLESGNYEEDSNDSDSGSNSDNGSDNDNPYKSNYLQKLRQDATIDHLKSVHHELQHHNYQEVSVRTQIERNDEGVIIDPYHRTPPFLSKYEKARILGIRTTQLNHGHMPMVQTRNADNALIALEEYRQKKIPFIIRRPLPNGTSEYWKFADLEQL